MRAEAKELREKAEKAKAAANFSPANVTLTSMITNQEIVIQ